jgi:hypothetical protein
MRNEVQILPLAALRGAAALVGALVALGCSDSGDVVVVIDSTMRAESVEVVALPTDPALRVVTASGPHATDSIARLRALDDSVAAIDARFQMMRDQLSSDVGALDTADRRTRSYAVRYAEIRRRTLAAEALRAARDSMRTRAAAFRSSLGITANEPNAAAASSDAGTRSIDGRRAERQPARAGGSTVSLAPGPWWIGVATRGANPLGFAPVTVRPGSIDTVRFGARGPSRPPQRP